MRTNEVATPVVINDAAILIRIQRAYRPDMSAEQLYEVTRGVWVVGPRRSGAKFALAVFDGIVREVYEIDQWHPAGTTDYNVRPLEDVQRPGRWEFTGTLAQETVRDRYVGRSVAANWKRGAANPITYVNC